MSNYATKADSIKAIRIATSDLVLKPNVAKLKAEVDNIDVDKLKTVPVDFSKLSKVVNNEVVKKIVYDKLAAKLNNIDSGLIDSGLIFKTLKTKYDADKSSLEKKSNSANKKNL